MNNITLNTEEVYIKDIKPNDYILSYDIISKKNVPKKVLNIHRPIVNNKKQIQFNYEGGEIITSISHPTLVFRNKKYEYIEAGDVKKSDLLKGQNKDYNILKIIRHPNVDPNFIDLTIEDTNNYFAKENNSLNFIVMHNTNISWLRPKGSYINGIGARTPGVVKFMELWDKSSEIITKGCEVASDEVRKNEKKKIRKGAMMCVLEDWHPDIEEFITIKQTPNKLTKFNLSVGVSDNLICAIKNNEDWELIFPDTEFEKYDSEWNGDIKEWKTKNYPIKVYKKIKAKKLWNKIMVSTYNRNEPGVLFLDVINNLNALKYGEKVLATNPCGEICMSSGACNLGSLNLAKFFKFNKDENKKEFDFDNFKISIHNAIRFLDNINDIAHVPLQEYKQSMLDKRRIGLGVMGLGSLLFMMGMKYGSQKSLSFIEKIFKCKAQTELFASCRLGKEKSSFPKFDKKEYFNTKWWKELKIDPEVKIHIETFGTMRNSHRSANAPTGNCVRKTTRIKTKDGVKSIAEIFRENKINISKEEKNQSFIPIKTIEAETLEGFKRITGLYINNSNKIYSIKTKNNNKIEGTPEHKVLIKINDKTAKWIKLQELKVNDKILLKK